MQMFTSNPTLVTNLNTSKCLQIDLLRSSHIDRNDNLAILPLCISRYAITRQVAL